MKLAQVPVPGIILLYIEPVDIARRQLGEVVCPHRSTGLVGMPDASAILPPYCHQVKLTANVGNGLGSGDCSASGKMGQLEDIT